MPDSPYYRCPNAIEADKDRFNYMYNFHHKSTDAGGALYRLWPKISGYGKSPGGSRIFNLALGAERDGIYPNIPRAFVTDPTIGTAGIGYVTHNLRKTYAFNLGFTDGSVRTVQIRSDTPMPPSGNMAVTLRLPPKLVEAVRRDAKRAGKTMSAYVAAKLRGQGS